MEKKTTKTIAKNEGAQLLIGDLAKYIHKEVQIYEKGRVIAEGVLSTFSQLAGIIVLRLWAEDDEICIEIA